MVRGRLRRALAGIGVVAILAGASTACTSGQAEPVPEPPAELTSHPCDVFGPEALEAAGINEMPPKKRDDREDPYQSRACYYVASDPRAGMTVMFNGQLLADVEADTGAVEVQALEIEGHRAVVNTVARAKACVVSVEVGAGVIEVMAGYDTIDFATAEESCAFALQIARDLGPYFPDRL